MNEEIIATILKLFTGGDVSGALPIALVLIIGYLLKERKSLIEDNRKKDEKIDRILDDYYKGNLTLTEALNSLKLVLYEIKGKIN